MTITETKRLPTHRIFAVRMISGGDKAHWTEIGAAWANKGGFNLKIHLMPIDDADIVMREFQVETGDAP